MSYFKVKDKKELEKLEIGDRIEESDYSTLTPNGYFVQLEYVEEEEEAEKVAMKPGIWCVVKKNNNLTVEKTDFFKDDILEEYIKTKEIEDCVDCFFENLHVYAELKIELPKRNVLLYGTAGGGKSTSLTKIAKKYSADGNTAILVWHTSAWESYDVKNLIKRFDYQGVDKFIVIAEDLGGVEKESAKIASDSSLLSLLDNTEKTFTIPTCIISTTNYPEMFMANIANRPGRFDDKIEVGLPNKQARVDLLKFFAKEYVTDEAIKMIESDKCKTFSPAHIKEAYIRSRLKKKTLVDCINEIIKEQLKYNKGFQEVASLGLGFGNNSDD
jgi:SpoVK/Ycf46/Vps4 family AAA+-type ATPase